MLDMVVPRGCKVVYDEQAFNHLRESYLATCKYFLISRLIKKLNLMNSMIKVNQQVRLGSCTKSYFSNINVRKISIRQFWGCRFATF